MLLLDGLGAMISGEPPPPNLADPGIPYGILEGSGSLKYTPMKTAFNIECAGALPLVEPLLRNMLLGVLHAASNCNAIYIFRD